MQEISRIIFVLFYSQSIFQTPCKCGFLPTIQVYSFIMVIVAIAHVSAINFRCGKLPDYEQISLSLVNTKTTNMSPYSDIAVVPCHYCQHYQNYYCHIYPCSLHTTIVSLLMCFLLLKVLEMKAQGFIHACKLTNFTICVFCAVSFCAVYFRFKCHKVSLCEVECNFNKKFISFW